MSGRIQAVQNRGYQDILSLDITRITADSTLDVCMDMREFIGRDWRFDTFSEGMAGSGAIDLSVRSVGGWDGPIPIGGSQGTPVLIGQILTLADLSGARQTVYVPVASDNQLPYLILRIGRPATRTAGTLYIVRSIPAS